MEFRNLGSTGISTGVVGLGCEHLEGKSDTQVRDVIDAAFSAGMNYLDIFMPEPNVRSAIGAAIAGRRDAFFIQGHLCTVYEDGQYKRTRDLEKTKAAFSDLLERLGTEYVDVGMIHYVDSEEDFSAVFDSEIIAYAKSLKASGGIRYLGLSSHTPEIALRAVETGLIDVLMFSINPAYDFEDSGSDIYAQLEFSKLSSSDGCRMNSDRQELYAACEARGVGIVVMKALAGGRLLDASLSPFGGALTVLQCVSYALSRPGVASVLVGCATKAEVDAAAAYCEAGPEERDYSTIFAGSPRVKVTGQCMYCGHCKPCQSHIDIPMVAKLLSLALVRDEMPATVREHYYSLPVNADDCLACAQCEPNCPFGVKIVEMMARARRVFQR